MLIAIHTLPNVTLTDARMLTDIAEQVLRRGKERVMRVRIRELPKEDGLPELVLDVDTWPPTRHDCTYNRLVQLHQLDVADIPAYTFELARREAARNACPIHREVVQHLNRVRHVSEQLTVDPEVGVSIFVLKSAEHGYAFVGADVHSTHAALSEYFRSFL